MGHRRGVRSNSPFETGSRPDTPRPIGRMSGEDFIYSMSTSISADPLPRQLHWSPPLQRPRSRIPEMQSETRQSPNQRDSNEPRARPLACDCRVPTVLTSSNNNEYSRTQRARGTTGLQSLYIQAPVFREDRGSQHPSVARPGYMRIAFKHPGECNNTTYSQRIIPPAPVRRRDSIFANRNSHPTNTRAPSPDRPTSITVERTYEPRGFVTRSHPNCHCARAMEL